MGYAKELAQKACESITEAQETLSVADHIWLYEQLSRRLRYTMQALECSPFSFEFHGKMYSVYLATNCNGTLYFLVGQFGENSVIELCGCADGLIHQTREIFRDRMDKNDIEKLMQSTEEVDDLPDELDGMLDALLANIH